MQNLFCDAKNFFWRVYCLRNYTCATARKVSKSRIVSNIKQSYELCEYFDISFDEYFFLIKYSFVNILQKHGKVCQVLELTLATTWNKINIFHELPAHEILYRIKIKKSQSIDNKKITYHIYAFDNDLTSNSI